MAQVRVKVFHVKHILPSKGEQLEEEVNKWLMDNNIDRLNIMNFWVESRFTGDSPFSPSSVYQIFTIIYQK